MSSTSVAPETFDCRQAFVAELAALARVDKRIVAVCNDSVGSSNLVAFAAEFPDRLINVGIAEQNMVGVAAGLANGGYIPFVCAAAPFLTGRATEQIKSDIAYNGYHVVLCGMSPGMAYGELGPTHHSIEDLSWMRAISDLIVIVPADPQQTRDVVRWAVQTDKPAYVRIGRVKVPAVTPEGVPFELGRALQLRDGSDVTLVATGVTVSRARYLGARSQRRDDRAAR
jgi:transketolase